MNTPDQHQLKIVMDTVKHPMKALLGGPSVEQSKQILRDKFGWSDNRIYGLELHGAGQRRRNQV